jgi:hypothetical protein
MNIAFRTYQHVPNPQGLPVDWPAETVEIPNATELPPEYPAEDGWIFFHCEDYKQYKLERQAAYDAWKVQYELQQKGLLLKIYRYTTTRIRPRDEIRPPLDLDYTRGLTRMLYKLDTKHLGRVVKKEYFAEKTVDESGNVQLSDLIVRENIETVRDPFGDPDLIRTVITWIREDGTDCQETKVVERVLSINREDKLAESIATRQAFLNNLKMEVRGIIVPLMIAHDEIPQPYVDAAGGNPYIAGELWAVKFMETYIVAFLAFEKESNPWILDIMQNDPMLQFAWIDYEIPNTGGVTVRQYILSQFSEYYSG